MRCTTSTIAFEATGDANLGILQGFFRNLRSRGTAALQRAGQAGRSRIRSFPAARRITDGRIRHFSLPHALEAINGIDLVRRARASAWTM